MGIIPAITGKVELVYEGEQEGAGVVAEHLIGDAIKTFFPNYFPKIEKLENKKIKVLTKKLWTGSLMKVVLNC